MKKLSKNQERDKFFKELAGKTIKKVSQASPRVLSFEFEDGTLLDIDTDHYGSGRTFLYLRSKNNNSIWVCEPTNMGDF